MCPELKTQTSPEASKRNLFKLRKGRGRKKERRERKKKVRKKKRKKKKKKN